MKKILIITLTLFTFCSYAQEKKEKKKATFATKIIQNSVAGFSPIFFGSFETNKNFDITIYSVFWTNTSFGNPDAGSDLLLETGIGLGFKLLDNHMFLNPSIGFGHGKFFSDNKATQVGEGIIPNVYMAYNKGLLDFEGYVAYYKSLRDKSSINTKDYFLHWLAPGINVSDRLVLGAFYESLGITNQENNADDLQIYRFFGGSVKLKFDKGIAFRLSAGANLDTDIGDWDEFYKVSAFIPL